MVGYTAPSSYKVLLFCTVHKLSREYIIPYSLLHQENYFKY